MRKGSSLCNHAMITNTQRASTHCVAHFCGASGILFVAFSAVIRHLLKSRACFNRHQAPYCVASIRSLRRVQFSLHRLFSSAFFRSPQRSFLGDSKKRAQLGEDRKHTDASTPSARAMCIISIHALRALVVHMQAYDSYGFSFIDA